MGQLMAQTPNEIQHSPPSNSNQVSVMPWVEWKRRLIRGARTSEVATVVASKPNAYIQLRSSETSGTRGGAKC